MSFSFKATFLILSIFCFCAFGLSNLEHHHIHLSTQGAGDGLISLKTSHFLEATAPIAGDAAEPNSSFVLAEERTHRKDPFNNFKYYNGGWNISDRHYWASVAFTAVPFFLIAVIWFVGFGLALLLIGCYFCCCRRISYSYSRTAYALSLAFLVLFTIAAVIGCVVLYHAQAKAHKSTTGTLDYVVSQANVTVENLRNFSTTLSAAKMAGVDQVFMPSDVQDGIEKTQRKVNASADDLSYRVDDNSKKIQDGLDNMRLFLVIVSAIMLLLVFLGFFFSLLGQQFLVNMLVLVGWFLVAGTFILCGVFLLLHNVSADTCVAMNDWVKNPTSHTALDDILPCVDMDTANASLYQGKEAAFSLAKVINQVISNVSNGNYPPFLTPLYFNQSGPLMPLLCNPYNVDLSDRQCATGEVDFENASQVWKNYICDVSSKGICVTVGRITPNIYNQMISAATVSFGLYQYGPFLVRLEDCTFVRETFATISKEDCPGLRKYTERIYIGLVMVASAVMLSLVFWVIYARERRHRKYSKQFIPG